MAESSSEISGSLVPLAKREAMILLEAGYLWLDMGQFDKATDIFAGAVALMPKSEVPQLALGSLEFAQGRHDKALQAYRAAQRLAPQSGLPRAHAGEALLFMGKVPRGDEGAQGRHGSGPRGRWRPAGQGAHGSKRGGGPARARGEEVD